MTRVAGRWVIVFGLLGCATAAPPPAVTTPSASPARSPATAGRSPQKDGRYSELFEQGRVFYGQGDYPAALRALAEAKELDPAAPPAYLLTGAVMTAMRKTEAAAVEYKRAIELSPPQMKETMLDAVEKATSEATSAEERDLIAGAYKATEDKDPAKALPLLRRALDLNAANARTRYEIGYALIDLGRVDEAIPQFEEARRINPVSPAVLKELQYCYSDRKRFTELRGVVADRLLVEGETPGLLQELGFAYASMGNHTVAISTLEELMGRYPDFFPARYTLGQLYCAGTQRAKGAAQLDGFLSAARAARALGDRAAMHMSPEELDTRVREAQSLRASCAP